MCFKCSIETLIIVNKLALAIFYANNGFKTEELWNNSFEDMIGVKDEVMHLIEAKDEKIFA
jgi:hypothetical protein